MNENNPAIDEGSVGHRDSLAALADPRKPLFWQTLGIIAAASAAGGVAGFALAKGWLVAKGATAVGAKGAATPWVVGAKGATETTALPALAQPGHAALNTLAPAGTGAPEAGGGGNLFTWIGALKDNAAALLTGTAGGAAGGGAAGMGLARQQVEKVREQMETRLESTAKALREETAQLRTVVDAGAAGPGAREARREPPAGDHLEGIRGIGEVYAHRLRQAGIGSFAELAATSVARIREIIGRGAPLADENLKSWIEQAARLAQQQE